MKNNIKISISGYFIYLIGIILLIVSYFLDFDGYGNALSGDFRDTWPYVIELNKNFWIDPSKWTLHFPLHYFILSKVYLISESKDTTRLFFLLISLITPYLLYLNLKEKYNFNKNLLFILSSVIFFTPSFIYSAVWANNNNLSYIFMLLGSYFYLKQIKELNNSKKLLQIYLTLFFFALVCYSRQYYSVLYGYFIFVFYLKLSFKDSFYISIYSLLLSLPGIIFLYSFPMMYEKLSFSGNIFNTILGNVTSLSLYVLPIYVINLFFNKSLKFNFRLIRLIFPLLLFLATMHFHDVEKMDQNGGIFYILSNKILNNLLLFYLLFFINLICIFKIFENKKDIFILFSIILLISGIIVLQKYFEPLFYIFFFLFSNSKFKEIFLNNYKACISLVIYNIFYTVVALTNFVHLN
jgi:hypothetical protein